MEVALKFVPKVLELEVALKFVPDTASKLDS